MHHHALHAPDLIRAWPPAAVAGNRQMGSPSEGGGIRAVLAGSSWLWQWASNSQAQANGTEGSSLMAPEWIQIIVLEAEKDVCGPKLARPRRAARRRQHSPWAH